MWKWSQQKNQKQTHRRWSVLFYGPNHSRLSPSIPKINSSSWPKTCEYPYYG